ncbi:hypothetical protein SAMN05660649_02658 [Desulfotomaculum arcticum]|uniref:Voltage-dependent anion channel n=2 Tax=Desulfotruncus TaxID=2867377 RepID=A0A1I2UJG8_9FIRM|nr:hypothetical protein [Desulfotruncus arcticus]SFG77275.1 hypothetical protein SAMN05660649_02658 [Desulfotomaculum arcticum] [Desulfotruncus arcticus DSM 17038]
MKFSPFKFQLPLAAGGVALMAYNLLLLALPYEEGAFTISNIAWGKLSLGQTVLYYPLILLMLALTIINLLVITVFVKQLIQWLFNKEEYTTFMSGPPTQSIGAFVPIASLSMTACVIFGPLTFFIPELSYNNQSLMLPGLLFYGFLLFMLLALELKLLKIWFSQPLDVAKLNFVWLLDVFAFGLVNLTGTGIAAMASDKVISSTAAFASFLALTIGGFLLITKLSYLIYLQIKANDLAPKPVQPSYFLIVPISCLFGFSFYRITLYLQTHFKFNVEVLSFFFINFSYVITIGWIIFSLYLLNDYFKNYFYKSDFSPTQWSMV